MKQVSRIIVLFVMILSIGNAAWAAAGDNAAAARGKTYLLSIGISDYKYLAAMKAPANNAELFAKSLQSINGTADIVLLIDGQATRERIIAVLADYVGKLADGDRLIIYYSGHGGKNARQYRPNSQYDGGYQWRDDNNLYDETIFPVDAGYDLKSQITFADIAGYVKKLRNVDAAVIIDCPYSPTNDWFIDAPRNQGLTRNVRPRTSLRDLNIYGVTVIDSADWNETAAVDVFNGKMYGVFSYYFSQGIVSDAVRRAKGQNITLNDAFVFARTVTLQEVGLQHPRIYRGKNPALLLGPEGN